MKILIDIDHPSTIHLFKHFIWQMQKKGHTFVLTAIEKEMVFDLLQEYQFPFVRLGNLGESKWQKIINLPAITAALARVVDQEKPNLIMGASTIPGAWVAKHKGIPCINFEDTEIASLAHRLYRPFVQHMISPEHYGKDFGEKHIRYKGFKELAYTHPNSFQPDPSVLQDLGVGEHERYFVVRFSSWGATHDIGKSGLSFEQKKRLVQTLSEKGRVFISSEGPLEPEFEAYRYQMPFHHILDVLAFADVFVTDAHTMATEAALLGTPAIRCNSLVGENDMRNFIELEGQYGLLYSYREFEGMMHKLEELLVLPDLKAMWAEKQKRVLADKVDLTQWMMDFVEERYVHQESCCL